MAWTVTRTPVNFGSLNGSVLKVLTDGAESTIDTGLGVIVGFALGHISMTAITTTIYQNQGTTSTAANGVLGCSGFTSGDEFVITVYGR
jgi:hypothetical protein